MTAQHIGKSPMCSSLMQLNAHVLFGKAQPALAQGGDKYVCQLKAASGNSHHDTF